MCQPQLSSSKGTAQGIPTWESVFYFVLAQRPCPQAQRFQSLLSWFCICFEGKFGGLQNKAPQLERMRGAVFAAPLPLAFHSLSTQIGKSLKSLCLNVVTESRPWRHRSVYCIPDWLLPTGAFQDQLTVEVRSDVSLPLAAAISP